MHAFAGRDCLRRLVLAALGIALFSGVFRTPSTARAEPPTVIASCWHTEVLRQRKVDLNSANLLALLDSRIVSPQRQRQAQELIEQLNSDDFATRELASSQLSKLGPLAAPALRQAEAAHQEPEVRRRAGQLLAEFEAKPRKDGDALELRALLVEVSHRQLAGGAEIALRLLPQLTDPALRHAAAEVLGNCATIADRPALLKIVSEALPKKDAPAEKIALRSAAITALERLDGNTSGLKRQNDPPLAFRFAGEGTVSKQLGPLRYVGTSKDAVARVSGGKVQLEGDHDDAEQRLTLEAASAMEGDYFPRKVRIVTQFEIGPAAEGTKEASDMDAWRFGMVLGNVKLLFQPNIVGGRLRVERDDTRSILIGDGELGLTLSAGTLYEVTFDVTWHDDEPALIEVTLKRANDKPASGKRAYRGTLRVQPGDIGALDSLGFVRTGGRGGSAILHSLMIYRLP